MAGLFAHEHFVVCRIFGGNDFLPQIVIVYLVSAFFIPFKLNDFAGVVRKWNGYTAKSMDYVDWPEVNSWNLAWLT